MIEESTSHLQAIVWFALIVCRRPQLFGCLVLKAVNHPANSSGLQ